MIDLVATLRLADNLTKPLRGISIGAGVALGGIAAVTGKAINKFVEFDDEIRKAGAVAGASATELESLRQTALDLGASTSESATSAATALTELAAGGFSVQDSIAALPGIISAAEASGEELASTASAISSALSIFSIEASESGRVADILAQSANQSAADITSLASSFQYAGPTAATLGISIEELAAATGILADNGIDGSAAGTALRSALSRLNEPVGKGADLVEELGIQVRGADNEFLGLAEVVGNVGKALEGQSEAQKVSTLTTILGQEAVGGFLNLIKAGPEELMKLTAGLENSGGAAAETAEKMKAGLGGALEELGGAYETFQIEVGAAFEDLVRDIAVFISEIDTTALIENITSAVATIQEVGGYIVEHWRPIVGVVAGITAGIIGFRVALTALSIISAITNLIALYRSGVGLATAAQMAFNLSLLANPIGIIAVAIGVLIGVIVFLVINWDAVTSAVGRAFDAIGGVAGIISIILGPLGFLINAAIDLASNWDSTRSIWENVWAAIKTSAEIAVNAAIGLVNGLITAINNIPFINIGTIDKVDFTSDDPRAKVQDKKTPKKNFHGLDNVPYNGYQTILHRGERVLTAQENKELNNGGSIGNGGGVSITGNTFNVRQESDINEIAYRLAKLIEGERVQIG